MKILISLFRGVLLLPFLLQVCEAQYAADARKIIDTLTSAEMNGRGYLKEGDVKAADYIRNYFEALQLKKFKEKYFQPFNISVNTFPEKIILSVNDRSLKTGTDFIVQAYSGTVNGNFKVIRIDSSILSVKKLKKLMGKASKNTFLVFEKKKFSKNGYGKFLELVMQTNCFGFAGMIELTEEKLTMDMSEGQNSFAHLIVKKSALPEKINIIYLQLKADLLTDYQTRNVIGYIQGSEKPDSFLVFSAHYDHLGQLGEGVYFPGANDNASGISMLLEMAKYFSLPENQPKYSIVFMAFSGEELGLLGSHYYTEHPLFPLGQIKFLLNMDIVGTGDEGIKVVNGAVLKTQFDMLVKLNEEHHYLKSVQPRGKAANSDHYFFFEKGVPAFFIYTLGGIDAYHDVNDKSVTLPLTEYDNLFKLLLDFEAGF